MPVLDLPDGYYELPPGKLANIATFLEMTSNPLVAPQALPAGLSLRKVDPTDVEGYRALFRKVGETHLWLSRLIMPDEKLRAILGSFDVESYVLYKENTTIGILELDFRDLPNCELAFFGLVPDAVGSGVGRSLMNVAIAKAWARPITRLWVHTCHFDHPNAISFYQRSGFKPFKIMLEVHDDPRQLGKLPKSAGPHVALIEK